MPRIKGTEVAKGVYSPIIKVDFRCNGVGGLVPAIVDSGADKCLVPGDFVEAAGVTFASLTPLPEGTGAGGQFPKSLCKGQISYAGCVLCDEFEVVPPGLFNFILLGREEFFSKFVVRFQWHRDPPFFDVDPVVKP